MFVNVCGHRLVVRVENDVRKDCGTPTYELFRPARPDVVLDMITPPSERLFYLRHALVHAYDHYIGRIAEGDTEGTANRMATIQRQLDADLRRQGGVMALHAIFGDTELPLDSQDTLGDAVYVDAEAETADWPTDVCCPGCKDIYKARALRKGRIHFDPKIDGFQVRVALTCGKCEREWVWTTRCSPEGQIWPKVTVAPVSRDLMPAERMN